MDCKSTRLRIGTAIRSSRTRLAGHVILLVLLSLAPVFVSAEQIQVTLDPAQTSVDWTLVASLHTVHGTFKMKSGTVSFDPKSGAASGVIIVDATSGESGNHSRDKKMHKEILESPRYPEITFTPKRVLGSVPQKGNSTIQVQGLLHLHGSAHDLTLSIPMEINGDTVKASTSFVVPYQDWGMKDPGNFFLHVGKTVTLNVAVAGRLTRDDVTGTPH
jgi:polyisoprenoid-binding protein YceI